jgi:DNA-binding transcriptional regulator LsrR (DeoR family)
MTASDPITELREAHAAYEAQLEESEQAKLRRDAAVLAATEAGMTRAQIGAELGVNRARVQQIVDRAREGA